jgi:YidC/Oxa1 family membrane protein insertase
MRQAPFALWITDLSSKDPYFILPALNGAAMLFQQKLNPQPADPVQTKVMQIMPIMFTFMFAFFPSGLVLYWLTNTILSFSQQWHINKTVALEGHKNILKKMKAKEMKKEKEREFTWKNVFSLKNIVMTVIIVVAGTLFLNVFFY